jgi:hypothetical protein
MHWRADARDARVPLKRIAVDALDVLGDPSISWLRRCYNTTSCGFCSSIPARTSAVAGAPWKLAAPLTKCSAVGIVDRALSRPIAQARRAHTCSPHSSFSQRSAFKLARFDTAGVVQRSRLSNLDKILQTFIRNHASAK